MDAKDLRTETTIGERSNNGSSKFAQGGAATATANSASKPYDSISANPLAKLETPTSRPCAVIGPDRIVPPSNVHDTYSKKSHYEPWLNVDNTYRQPPEYPHKLPSYQSPIRNISPRQTFQENMQRIMVQPTYNSVKLNEDSSYTAKSSKIPGSHEPKYCDVPYTVNPISSDQKPNEMCVNNMNSSRNYPQMWHPGSVGVRPARPYGAPELYQFPEYTGCAAPRPMPMPRPHRTMNEDPSHPYSETYYPEGNIRFKPYPTIKERYPQARYEYLSNYGNTFHHPPPFPTHKYDVQKALPPHLTYPQVPMKYLDNRMTDTVMDGYQRPQTVNYNVPYRNQVIHPAYGPMLGSNIPNKVYPYPPDGSVKSLAPNKLPYDSKLYADYENARNKGYSMPDSVYLNEMVRPHMKNPPVLPNYPNANMQQFHAHPYYRKENLAYKNYEYMSHLRHLDPSLSRLPTQFSPSAIAISPSDSNTSNETSHTNVGSLEDCGYVSQSSTASIRSYDSVNRMIPNDFHQRYNYPYQQMARTSPSASKPGGNNACNTSKDKKNINVRQFLQMWNEGEDENGGKEKEVSQSDFNQSKLANQYETMKANEQLYVLGLVNVPSEELGKYEHIQKISKLPENIKGYNNIELLKHFEEAIESSNINNSNHKPPTPRNYYPSMKSPLVQGTGVFPPRPISPLDVEAKISQSVIHKEVGCNFEIKPCSPEMLNAEVATTAQSILGDERVIEKISNPIIIKSPKLSNTTERENMCDSMNNQEHKIMLKDDVNKTASCKMINTQFSNNDDINAVKSNYSIQDLESNAGVCLASLPILDNELELNFPEVNQQFINANKESVIITNDFTAEIDSLPDNNTFKINKNVLPKSDSTTSPIPTLDIETEVSKLSKFRKVKRNESEYNEKQFVTASQSLRTDSVIIKNPENVKSFEKNTVAPTLEKKLNESQSVNHDSINSPVNPIENNHDQINIPVNPPKINEIIVNHAEDSIETAIDFSLNRMDTNTISENSNYLCKIAKTPVLLPENLLYQQLPERGNTVCSPTISTNDIIKQSPVPDDEVNNMDMKHHACEDPKKSRLHIENPDIKECHVAPQQSVIDVEYSENCSKHFGIEIADKESECCNIIREISVDETESKNLKETTEFEKHNKSITQIKESTVYSTDNNIDEEAEHSLFCKTPIDHKIRKPDATSNTRNKNVMNSTDSFCCNFIEENYEFPPVNCNFTTVDIDASNKCLNYVKAEVTHNDTIESDVTDSLMTPETEENVVSSLKRVSLRKELFSPQIQNLILWSEGNSLIIFSQNGSKISSPTISNVRDSRTTVLDTHRDSDNCKVQSNLDDIKDSMAVDNAEIEVPDVENIISESRPQSDSTDVVQYLDHDSEAKALAKDELVNVMDDTSNESKSGSTYSDGHFLESVTIISTDQSNPDINIECITVPNPDAAVLDEDDFISVKAFSSNNKSQPKNVTIFSASTSKNNLHEAFTNNEHELVRTDIKNCQVSGSDSKNVSSAITGVSCEFQSTSIEISQVCPTADLEEKTSDESNTNKMLQSPYASDLTNIETYPLESGMESTVVNQSHDIKIDVDKSENETNDCVTLDSNIFQTDKLSLNIETDCTISEPQPEPETLISSSMNISAADELNNAKNCASVNDQLESNTDKDNEKLDLHEIKSDVGPNSANQVDGANSVCPTISNYDETCAISGKKQVISTAESSEWVRESDDCELQPKATYVKDSVLSNLVEDSNEIKSSVVSKCPSESTFFSESPILKTDVDPRTCFAINNLNNATVDTNVERKSESKEIEPYPIPDLDSNKNLDISQTHLEFDCAKNESTHKIDNIHSNPPNRIESSQIVKYERDIKLDNIQEEICSSSNALIEIKSHRNDDYEPNITIGDDFNEIEHIADDSGVHSQNESIILEEQAICGDELLGEELNTNRPSIIQRGLKRSLSDSALNSNNYKPNDGLQEDNDIQNLVASKKRRKYNNFLNIGYPQCSTSDMLNVHINRRNSISSLYNDENMSFCIVIDDNCIITEENEEGEKLCYTEIPEACLTGMHSDNFEENSEIVICPQENTEYEDPFVLEISNGKSLEESWVDDVACVETVVSDDIAEDVELSAPPSPAEIYEEDNDESGIFTSVSEHTEKVKYIYGDKMCNDDAELVETLYRTPQMDVNKTLINRESLVTDDDDDDEFHRENIVNSVCPEIHDQNTKYDNGLNNKTDTVDKQISFTESGGETLIDKNKLGGADNNLSSLVPQGTSNNPTESLGEPICLLVCDNKIPNTKIFDSNTDSLLNESCETPQDDTINSCESSVDNVFSYNHDGIVTDCPVFSSPEVSSTTSEEKNTSLLLKITNHQGTRTSQLNDTNLNKKNSCKFTENINYTNFISNSTEPRPLITKAAQKYIPPLKETVNDLKVKLHLPRDSLIKFKQLKIAKTVVRHSAVPKKEIPKKTKPKFEDVLKSIDEIQFKMHREKGKKPKKTVPKVVIKKTENGSHYASTPNSDCYNPDLTGRKWQPWVIIEKNSFIDKMALRRKTQAVYNHRNKTYVFADKFKKYKSMQSAKFVITQPKLDNNSSGGQLKYTIRLKHSY